MKKEIVMWLIIAVLVVGALLLGTQKAETMAINFVNGSSLKYTNPTAVLNLATKTVTGWIQITGNNTAGFPHVIFLIDNAGVSTFEFLVYRDATYNSITVSQNAATSGGLWFSNQSLALNTPYRIVITYDNSLAANDPIIYLNGVAQSLDSDTNPVGAVTSETGLDAYIGGYATVNEYSRIIIHDQRVYNRIWTAAEVALDYSARGRDNIRNGLVSCPFLNGAAGLQAFDGATLVAGNTIVDPCSGAVGVPAGNPVGVGETYLR